MTALARTSDPGTSHDAAASVPTQLLERLVLGALVGHPGTSEEIAKRTGLRLVTVSPRLKPLEGKGLVYRNGRRKNQSGATATVWALCAERV